MSMLLRVDMLLPVDLPILNTDTDANQTHSGPGGHAATCEYAVTCRHASTREHAATRGPATPRGHAATSVDMLPYTYICMT